MNKHGSWSQAIVRYASQYFGRQYREVRFFARAAASRPRDAPRLLFRRLVNLTTGLILAWILLLSWGESNVFSNSISSCDWSSWEQWPRTATPHHLVFIADPQLVDPHTYPGRSWPLSILTVKHTDNYLKRAYSRIQKTLDPQTIIFLGDLFDGGREWSTQSTSSKWENFKQYGDLFWMKEFDRFHNIFLREWAISEATTAHPRRIIASLPGNHDLGFAKGIQKPVRDRFNAYFGDGNRVDVIGNHTFVSVDSVSLSAIEQDNDNSTTEIWLPAEEFLSSVEAKTQKAIEAFLNDTRQVTKEKFGHDVETLQNNALEMPTIFDETILPHVQPAATFYELPTILLTHVPLYRTQGTPCGPLREHWPPTPPPPGQTTPVIPDDRNSLLVIGGHGEQYQNVLTESLTQHIITKLDGEVSYAFSGDDHDYCDVLHTQYAHPSGTSGIREITVKSLSWAMGVRKPGFVLVSLWNEVDGLGRRVNAGDGPTLQTHLCLLPDQLAIIIRYGIVIGLSLALLLARAIVTVRKGLDLTAADAATLLPSFTSETARTRSRAVSSAELEKASAKQSLLSSRSGGSNPAFARPQVDAWDAPSMPAEFTDDANADGWGYDGQGQDAFTSNGRSRVKKGVLRRVVEVWLGSVCRVGVVAVTWFFVLWFRV